MTAQTPSPAVSMAELYEQVAAGLSATHADVEQTEPLAMVVNGCLVVKLPRNRVDQLVVTAPASDSTMATDAR